MFGFCGLGFLFWVFGLVFYVMFWGVLILGFEFWIPEFCGFMFFYYSVPGIAFGGFNAFFLYDFVYVFPLQLRRRGAINIASFAR